ncbi:MAG: thermonuclease family protein [Methylobacteriaceae bacterium]|nr:thermonuclease family protein [Methylobacteriaceae bacterium]
MPSRDRLAGLTEAGEIRLTGERTIRLADLRLPERGPAAERSRAVLLSLAGSEVNLQLGSASDRWGRWPAAVTLAGAAPVKLAELLVAEGLALVDPGPADALCRPALLATEAAARAQKAGIWSEPGWPIPATDLEALRERAGRFAVIEGRIVSIGERRDRTYLDFGRDWSRDFVATVPRRVWAAVARRGMTAAALRGRTVRLRGVVEIRRGPNVEVLAADMLEWADGQPGRH